MASRSHRDEFSRKVRAAVFLRAAGQCEECRARLKLGEGEVDHILPVQLGGEPVIENARLLCRACHAEKTAGDIRQIRKSDRQRDKHTGALRPKQAISGPRRRLPKNPASAPLTKWAAWNPYALNAAPGRGED